MEVRIGIIQSPREISFETDASAADLHAAVETALEGGKSVISFTDAKSRQYLVPAAAIAYVEIGGDTGRKVGFVS